MNTRIFEVLEERKSGGHIWRVTVIEDGFQTQTPILCDLPEHVRAALRLWLA